MLVAAPLAGAQTSTTTAPSASGDEAQSSTLPPTTTSTSLPGAVDIGYGYSFTGAAIGTVGGAVSRRLNAYQAAAFMQSWFAGGTLASQNQPAEPPPSADVYRVDVTGNWDDKSGTMTVYYASIGGMAWISFPLDQTPTLEPYTEPYTPSPPADWVVAPEGTIDAFHGNGSVSPPLGITDPTDPNAPVDESSVGVDDGSGGDGSSFTWIWVALAATAVAAVVVSSWLRRGDGEPDEPGQPTRRVMARAKVRSNGKPG